MASRELSRIVRGTLATGLIVAGIATVSSNPALADPQAPAAPAASSPTTSSQAEQQLGELGHQAEVVNEQLLGVQTDLAAKRAQLGTSTAKRATADAALGAAQGQQEQFRATVDALTSASYQGARLNRLSALMLSKSPQDLLDQMSGLDVLASDTTARVNSYAAASAQAVKAGSDAASAASAAKAASDAAATLQADLQRKQAELSSQTSAVRAKYNSLTQAERTNFAGTTMPAGFVPPELAGASSAAPGSSAGARALQAALSKLGAPYAYGASGPDAFDCSGLTQWSYRQAGVSIPRTAQAQAGGGTPVSRDQLQPGDLVFFYNPISHVGIYAGNGNVVHAVTEGQPVKVAPMSYLPYSGARRY